MGSNISFEQYAYEVYFKMICKHIMKEPTCNTNYVFRSCITLQKLAPFFPPIQSRQFRDNYANEKYKDKMDKKLNIILQNLCKKTVNDDIIWRWIHVICFMSSYVKIVGDVDMINRIRAILVQRISIYNDNIENELVSPWEIQCVVII